MNDDLLTNSTLQMPHNLKASPHGWRLIACDLDGTLVSRDHTINDTDKTAIRRAREAGLHVAICTGRHSQECMDIARELELTGPGVFVNGAIISDMASGKSLSYRVMDPDLADDIIDFFGSFGHATLALADDPQTRLPVYIRTQHAPPHKATVEWLLAHRLHALEMNAIGPPYRDHLVRLTIVVDTHEAPIIEHALTARFGDRIFSYSIFAAVYGAQVIEAFHPLSTKWSGIVGLCDMLGVSPAHAVAIGDDVNDLPMLRQAALSFAMGNASPTVQSAAKRITRPQAESGVAQVIAGILNGEW